MKKTIVSAILTVCLIFSCICVHADCDSKVYYQHIGFSDSAAVAALKDGEPAPWMYDVIRNQNRWRVLFNKDFDKYCFNVYLKYDISEIDVTKADSIELLLMQLKADGGSASYELYDIADASWTGANIENCSASKTADTTYKNYPLADEPFAGGVVESMEVGYEPDARVNYSFDITDYIKTKKAAGENEISFALAATNSYMDINLGKFAMLRVKNINKPEVIVTGENHAQDNMAYSFDVTAKAHGGNLSSVSVSFDGKDAGGATDIGAENYTDTFEIPANLMTAGEHTITVTAKDTDGYETSASKTVTAGYVINNVAVNASDVARVIKTDKTSIDNFFYDTWYLLGDIEGSDLGINMVMYYKFDISKLKNDYIENAYFIINQKSTYDGVTYHYRLRDVTDTSWTRADIQNSSPELLSNQNYKNYEYSKTPFAVSDFVPNVALQGNTVKLDITEYLRQKQAEGKTVVSMILGLDTSKYTLTQLDQTAGLEVGIKTKTNPNLILSNGAYSTNKPVSGEKVEYSVDVYNKLDTKLDTSVILCLYRNGKLLKTAVASGANPGENTLKAAVTMPDDIEGCVLKAFILNGLDSIAPLTGIDAMN